MSQWWFTPRLFGWAELNSVWYHMVRCKHWKTPQTFPRSAKFLHLPYLHSSDLTNAHWWLISFNEHHLWAQEGTGGKMQMQSAVVSTGRRKKSESPGQSREDLNSPLLPHQHTTSPCLPPPSRILTDSSAPASAPSELSSLQCLFLLPIIQSDSVLPSHPLSFRFSSPYHSVQTSSNPSHTLPPFLKS